MASISFSAGTLSPRSQTVILFALLALFAAGAWFTYNAVHISSQNNAKLINSVSADGQSVTNFQQCANAGNPVQQTYPETCTANGKAFVQGK